MSRKKRKKSIFKSAFYRVYFIALAVALAGIAIGTVWLRGLLADYESAQPIHVAEEVAQMFEQADFNAIYDVDTSAAQFAGGDASLYVSSLTELAQGRTVAWSEAFSADADARNYAVTLDGDSFATFTLVPSGETTPRGNRLWKLGSVTTRVALQEAEPEPEPEPEPTQSVKTYLCRIIAPQGYAVAVDGVTLSDGNARMGEKPMFEAGFLPEDVANPVMTEYLYDSPNPAPQVTATDEAGAEATVVANPDRSLTWTCQMKEDATYREQYSGAAISLGKQVAKFISGDAGKKSIQRICARNSPADEIFENLYNRYKTPHDGISFRNEAVTEFYALSDACFTCHVSFETVLNTTNGDMVDQTNYTFCVVRQGGSGKLYNILIS